MTAAPGIVTDRNSDAGKLCRAVEISDKRLEPFRRKRKEFLAHQAGPHYGQSWLDNAQPLNLIFSLAATLEPALSMRKIRSSVITRNLDLRPFADQQRILLDWLAGKVRLTTALRDCVRDALFGIGVLKVASGEDSLPYVEPISLDDWILDYRCRRRRPGGYAYEGHRFRVSFEKVMDGRMLERGARQIVENLVKNPPPTNKGAELSQSQSPGDDEYDPQVELIELYMPNRKGVVWLPGDLHAGTKVLRDKGWYGPEDGPIGTLGFAELADNAVPIPIMAVLFDLYMLENMLARKIARQAENQKDIVQIDSESPDAGEHIRKAQDGSYVWTPGAKAQVLSFGGANEKSYGATAWFHDFFTRIAGNLDIVGGLRASSKTLGQDQILASQAGIRVNDMRAMAGELASWAMRSLAWYAWNDPALKLKTSMRLKGGVEIPMTWRPGVRDGEFDDYEFAVSAYDRATDSPEDRYNRVKDLVSSIVIPLAPLAAQQGSYLNVDTVVNAAGRDLDIPEIEDLWIEGEPIQAPAAAAAGGGSGPGAGPGARRTAGQAPSAIEDMGLAAVEQGASP